MSDITKKAMQFPALDMTETKKKLMNIRSMMPFIGHPAEEIIGNYCKYLAECLNPQLVPAGFMLAMEMILDSCRKGENYSSFNPMPPKLYGYPHGIYTLLRMEFPKIIKCVLPEEFGKITIEYYEDINREMREKDSF